MAAWYQYHNLTINGLNKQWRLRSDCSYRQKCRGRGWRGFVGGDGGIAFEVRGIDVKSKECFQ